MKEAAVSGRSGHAHLRSISRAIAPRHAAIVTARDWGHSAPVNSSASRPAPAGDLLRIARGFAICFWGLALFLALIEGWVRIQLIERAPVARHAPAVLVILTASLLFWKGGDIGPAWRRHARTLIFAAVLQAYLLPFFRWWQVLPQQTFFTVNMTVFLLATVWMLLSINILAAELGRTTRNAVLAIEAKLCGWSVLVLAGVLLSLAVVDELREAFLHPLLAGRPLWLYTEAATRSWLMLNALVTLPFLLTMAVAWEARNEALAALLASRLPSGAPEDILPP